jgi:hypothetical protein
MRRLYDGQITGNARKISFLRAFGARIAQKWEPVLRSEYAQNKELRAVFG